MRRSLAALWHGLWLNRQQQSLLTVTLSLATSLWLWLEGGRVLDVESLQNLWRSTHHPQTLFEHLLAPLAGNPDLAVAIMAVLSTLSLWLYCRLSRLIGIGPQTTFILFLLLNFNPEYNDVRLQISRFQPVLLLWLAGLYLFLAHYKNHIHLAFLGWATTAWLGALFVPIAGRLPAPLPPLARTRQLAAAPVRTRPLPAGLLRPHRAHHRTRSRLATRHRRLAARTHRPNRPQTQRNRLPHQRRQPR